MTVTRCISSHLTSSLLSWRNPQDRNCCKNFGKIISTEVGLVILTVASTIETVAYATFTLLSLVLYPITNRPCKFFAKLAQSSSFTIIWGIANVLFFNLLSFSLETHESFVRLSARFIIPVVYRSEDRRYIGNIQERELQRKQAIADALRLQELQKQQAIEEAQRLHNEEWQKQQVAEGMSEEQIIELKKHNELVSKGAAFILDDILFDTDSATKKNLKEWDSDIAIYIMAKAMFVYAMGSKQKAEIPAFFNPTQIEIIKNLRKLKNSNAAINGIAVCLRNQERFDTTRNDVLGNNPLFKELMNQAWTGSNSCLLMRECWEEAAKCVILVGDKYLIPKDLIKKKEK